MTFRNETLHSMRTSSIFFAKMRTRDSEFKRFLKRNLPRVVLTIPFIGFGYGVYNNFLEPWIEKRANERQASSKE